MEIEVSDQTAVFKLIQLHTSGKSLNAADGHYLQYRHGLPGAVSEETDAYEYTQIEKSKDLNAEKEKQRQRDSDLLRRQREANAKDTNGQKNEKVDYSILKSEVSLESARNSTLSIATAVSRCSKIFLELDSNADAARDMPCVENEDCEDFQSSVQKLFRYVEPSHPVEARFSPNIF
jgi:hypothetical protein